MPLSSDFHLAHAALQASEEKFRTIASLVPVPVFQLDLGGYMLWVNDELLRQFNTTPEVVLGATYEGWVHPDDLPQAHEAWVAALGARTPIARTIRFLTGDGVQLTLEVRGVLAFNDDGAPQFVVGCMVEKAPPVYPPGLGPDTLPPAHVRGVAPPA